MTVSSPFPLLTPGDFVGDYQVLSLLGCGPTGMTYHAQSRQQDFAIKVLHDDPSIDRMWWDRLEVQGALLTRFDSPYFDRPLGSGKMGAFHFIVKAFQEFEEGKSCDLLTFRKQHGGRLPEPLCAQIFCHILKALQIASEYSDANHPSLNHGNLKPRNILILPSSEKGEGTSIRLTDAQPYGLFPLEDQALFYDSYEKMALSHSLAFQKNFEELLKAFYTQSFYQLPNASALKKDIFALGVILYESLCGQLPAGACFPKVVACLPSANPYWDELIACMLDPQAPVDKDFYSQVQENLKKEFPDLQSSPPSSTNSQEERLSVSPKAMAYIPAASFEVGAEDCGEDAMPIHNHTTQGFYLDKTCVTNAQFSRFIKESGYVTTAEREKGAPIWVEGKWQVLEGINWKNPTGQALPPNFSEHPVTQVTLEDVQAYCSWSGKRLPTEFEWEYAARGGKEKSRYPWGNTLNKNQANFLSDKTCRVASYPPNGYGLFDIVGNVWEWTASAYLPYPGNSSKKLPFDQELQVVRGGAWLYDVAYCQLSFRNANQPHHSYPTLGFRCAMDFREA